MVVKINSHIQCEDIKGLREAIDIDLKISNPKYLQAVRMGISTYGIPKHLYLYSERIIYKEKQLPYMPATDTTLLIPRQYTRVLQEQFKNIPVVDEMTDGYKIISLQSSITLREYQKKAVEVLVNTDNGILEAPCGAGKTIICLEAVAKVGVTTLIIVNTTALLEQWKERIKQVFGNSVRIGTIQGNTIDYKDKDIVVGMIPTLLKSKLPDDLFSYFGLVVSDECHRIAALKWSEVIQRFPARRRWGLTATPFRDDGLDIVFRMHIGHIIHKVELESLKPTIYGISTGFFIDEKEFLNKRSKQFSYVNFISSVANLERRNNMIIEYLLRGLGKGRKILVLSDRIAQLEYLKAKVDIVGRYKSMLYTAETPKDERLKAGETDVIFGISTLAKEGLDIPALDTLFIASPFKSSITVQQAVGRILRSYEGKQEPIVYDFIDNNISICKSLSYKRKTIYTNLGYTFIPR